MMSSHRRKEVSLESTKEERELLACIKTMDTSFGTQVCEPIFLSDSSPDKGEVLAVKEKVATQGQQPMTQFSETELKLNFKVKQFVARRDCLLGGHREHVTSVY